MDTSLTAGGTDVLTTHHPFIGWMTVHRHVLGHVRPRGQQPASRPRPSMGCRAMELVEGF
ncbi:hypothetical protein C0J52_11072 [Blattella germanica]|nr:hypothetical protein C0J52_11072 [Blattella germanica]